METQQGSQDSDFLVLGEPVHPWSWRYNLDRTAFGERSEPFLLVANELFCWPSETFKGLKKSPKPKQRRGCSSGKGRRRRRFCGPVLEGPRTPISSVLKSHRPSISATPVSIWSIGDGFLVALCHPFAHSLVRRCLLRRVCTAKMVPNATKVGWVEAWRKSRGSNGGGYDIHSDVPWKWCYVHMRVGRWGVGWAGGKTVYPLKKCMSETRQQGLYSSDVFKLTVNVFVTYY